VDAERPVGARHTTSYRTPAQLPAALPELVGRDRERVQVERLLADAEASSSTAVCVVGGVAGVGKTAFAVTVAHRLADRFPDGQLFADLHGDASGAEPGDPAEALGDFLQSLGVRPEAVPETTRARGLMFRDLLAGRRTLVVLDNARSAGQLKHLLPGSPGSMALVTSRMQLHALVAAYQALPLTLLPLSQADARSLLARRLGATRTAAEPEAVDRIIRLAGHLPLALANIAARAAYRPQLRLESLADEYEAAGRSLDAFTSEDDPGLDVRACLARSYRLLDPEAASVFRALSAWPGTAFAMSDAASMAGQPEQRVRRALARLIHTHLVSETAPGSYNWNRLVAAYAAEQAGTDLSEAAVEAVTRDAPHDL
ncbi:AfsR/SARP family transcriptional regulator, partial [Streptomyces sp. NPDC003333]